MLNLGQHGFGGRHPDKESGLSLVVLYKGIDFTDELSYVGERTVSNGFLGNDAEAALHLIDP